MYKYFFKPHNIEAVLKGEEKVGARPLMVIFPGGREQLQTSVAQGRDEGRAHCLAAHEAHGTERELRLSGRELFSRQGQRECIEGIRTRARPRSMPV